MEFFHPNFLLGKPFSTCMKLLNKGIIQKFPFYFPQDKYGNEPNIGRMVAALEEHQLVSSFIFPV